MIHQEIALAYGRFTLTYPSSANAFERRWKSSAGGDGGESETIAADGDDDDVIGAATGIVSDAEKDDDDDDDTGGRETREAPTFAAVKAIKPSRSRTWP